MNDRERYYKFSTYLRERFGCRIHKISLDAGFSCPNRDGSLSDKGCIYCDNRAFSLNTRLPVRSIETQIREGMDFAKERYGAEKFIVYFQAYTNTYAPLEVLKERYDIVRKFDSIVGIAIGTRPDCIDEKILDLIEGYSGDYEVWIEYGLQSIHKKTLELINRNHSWEDFLSAVSLTRKRRIKICAHVIIGLPQEARGQVLQTAEELGRLRMDGVKIHPLHIVKGTGLEELFRKGAYMPLTLDEFVELVTEFLKNLWPNTVIQRITADCPPPFLVGPAWILDKGLVLDSIEKRLTEKNTFQGAFYKEVLA